nr:hypothetical protein [Tanacetum cinerariifolium]
MFEAPFIKDVFVFLAAATKRPFNITSKRNQKSLHSKHAPPPAKPSPPLRNPILRSAKHAPPLANPKPKAPKLKAFTGVRE